MVFEWACPQRREPALYRITSGPFADFIGYLVRTDRDTGETYLRVSFHGSDLVVQVAESQIEPQ